MYPLNYIWSSAVTVLIINKRRFLNGWLDNQIALFRAVHSLLLVHILRPSCYHKTDLIDIWFGSSLALFIIHRPISECILCTRVSANCQFR